VHYRNGGKASQSSTWSNPRGTETADQATAKRILNTCKFSHKVKIQSSHKFSKDEFITTFESLRFNNGTFGGIPLRLPRLRGIETHDWRVIISITVAHHAGLILVGISTLIRVSIAKVMSDLIVIMQIGESVRS
jgi:hypothetical protein